MYQDQIQPQPSIDPTTEPPQQFACSANSFAIEMATKSYKVDGELRRFRQRRKAVKETQGKFILFDVAEFGSFLSSVAVSRVIQLVQNHHTFVPSFADFKGSNHFGLLRAMEAAHLERGFAEIAQNLTTFPDATVALCRSLDKIPAGIKGANSGGICIENVGNFDQGKDVITDAQKTAIIQVNALLCRKFNLQPNPDTIVYHHWFDLNTGERTNGAGSTKSCPGTGFFGGNSVADSEANFIPLIAEELQSAGHVQPIEAGNILFTARVTSEMLNVRALPDASGKKIKALNMGIIVNVFELSGSWRRIHPQESQWVNGKFLDRIVS